MIHIIPDAIGTAPQRTETHHTHLYLVAVLFRQAVVIRHYQISVNLNTNSNCCFNLSSVMFGLLHVH